MAAPSLFQTHSFTYWLTLYRNGSKPRRLLYFFADAMKKSGAFFFAGGAKLRGATDKVLNGIEHVCVEAFVAGANKVDDTMV
jgi:hypothetical protein